MSEERYSTTSIILHWLVAILVLFNIILAFTANYAMPRADKLPLLMIHAATGLTILALSAVRLGWRVTHAPPPLMLTLPARQRQLVRWVHAALYALLIAVPLAGWCMSSARGRSVNVFGLFTLAPLPLPKTAASSLHTLHLTLAYSLTALIALHVAGALKHLLNRDGGMERMWFERRPATGAGKGAALTAEEGPTLRDAGGAAESIVAEAEGA